MGEQYPDRNVAKRAERRAERREASFVTPAICRITLIFLSSRTRTRRERQINEKKFRCRYYLYRVTTFVGREIYDTACHFSALSQIDRPNLWTISSLQNRNPFAAKAVPQHESQVCILLSLIPSFFSLISQSRTN